MTNESLQAQLADAELDRLEELLSDDALPNAMRLDEIQGYLCAALTGPQPIAEEEWLADALGDEALLETEIGREVADLLRRFAEQQRRRLDADQRIVLTVLMRIDGVVGDHPGDRAGVEEQRRRVEATEHTGPALQRAP